MATSTIPQSAEPLVKAFLAGGGLPGNAGFHNSIYRGKYLGASVTAAQYAAISAGTFDDLFIGDYWTINSVNWRVAAFDYWFNTGDTGHFCTAHHAVIVPDSGLLLGKMNSADTTAGAYVGSDFYTGNNSNGGKAACQSAIAGAFGSAHLLSHRECLSNAVTDGYESADAWYDSAFDLMTEQMVYGGRMRGNYMNNSHSRTIGSCQLPLFAYDKSRFQAGGHWWLRDVASSTEFCIVSGLGDAGKFQPSEPLFLRPAFGIKA